MGEAMLEHQHICRRIVSGQQSAQRRAMFVDLQPCNLLVPEGHTSGFRKRSVTASGSGHC